MGYYVEHKEDNLIPDWLKSALSSKCQYCGSPMLNYYNDDCRCTNRKCSNENCYGYIASKADFARKLIKIEGIGFAGCLRDAILIKAKSVFELFKYWGIKPKVNLDTFLRMHAFEGVDGEWEKIVQTLGIYSLDELYDKYNGKWKSLLEEHKEEIYNNSSYVTIKERPAGIIQDTPSLVYNIMITGTPIGFQTKEHFIETLNTICKGRIKVLHQKTKKQSGVFCLIREKGSTTRGKVETAKKAKIPIVTSEEFMLFLAVKLQELNLKNEQ